MKRAAILCFLAFLLVGWALVPASDETMTRYARSARLVARKLPLHHLSHLRCDDDIATRALDIFLDTLDYDHSYFLASDIEEFRQKTSKLDNYLQRGELDFPFEVYELLLKRIKNRVDYIDELFKNGFDLNKEETFTWKRNKASWPANEQEWDELWRKKIKHQYVSSMVERKLDELEQEKSKEKATEEATTQTNSTNDVAAEKTEEKDPQTPEEEVKKRFTSFLELLEENDADWLLSRYIKAFVRAYDPHSDFMSKNDLEDFDIQMRLSLVGIGAVLSKEDGTAKVQRLIPGGPAEKDGRLKAGDKIIGVGQGDDEIVDILHWPLSRSVRLIRGEKGKKVVLKIIPADSISGSHTETIDIIRDKVNLSEKEAKSEIREIKQGTDSLRFGIITAPEFYADMHGQQKGDKNARSVTKDIRKLLTELQTNNISGLLLDLRNNGGGALTEAIELSGLFIEDGPIVQVKNSNGTHILRDPDMDQVYGGPMVVLVNRHSASASEILAGALKDYGRAVIVGDTQTHGKGTVQSLMNLSRFRPELGALKLTTAIFYRIEGGSTQIDGVMSDITVPSVLEHLEVGEQYLSNPISWSAIKPVNYKQSSLKQILPELEERSAQRCATNVEYQAYKTLVDHYGTKRKEETISLIFSNRMELGKQEREMAEFFDNAELTIEPENFAEDSDESQKDPVLDEALRILSDLVELSAKTQVAKS